MSSDCESERARGGLEEGRGKKKDEQKSSRAERGGVGTGTCGKVQQRYGVEVRVVRVVSEGSGKAGEWTGVRVGGRLPKMVEVELAALSLMRPVRDYGRSPQQAHRLVTIEPGGMELGAGSCESELEYP